MTRADQDDKEPTTGAPVVSHCYPIYIVYPKLHCIVYNVNLVYNVGM